MYKTLPLHTELLAKLETAESTGNSKSTSEEGRGARERASESRTSAGSTGGGGGGGGGSDQSENSLTYTKEQVEVVQRSD